MYSQFNLTLTKIFYIFIYHNLKLLENVLQLLNQTNYKNSIDLSIHMVEISNKYSFKQANNLGCSHLESKMDHNYFQRGKTSNEYASKDIFWYYNLDHIPKNTFSFIVAQEFFDALPVHKFRVNKIKKIGIFCSIFICLNWFFFLEMPR